MKFIWTLFVALFGVTMAAPISDAAENGLNKRQVRLYVR